MQNHHLDLRFMPSGRIDFDYYHRRAAQLRKARRRQAVQAVLRGIAAVAGHAMAPLRNDMLRRGAVVAAGATLLTIALSASGHSAPLTYVH